MLHQKMIILSLLSYTEIARSHYKLAAQKCIVNIHIGGQRCNVMNMQRKENCLTAAKLNFFT